MTVFQTSEPDAATSQLAVYNQNIGGNLNKSMTFSVPGGISWAVVGCVLVDAATPASVESTLIPAIEALAQVTSVNGDQVFGQVPATVEAPSHECVLYVTSQCTMVIGGADNFDQTIKAVESIKPPVAKKWVVMVLRVPAPLDATAITALESAIEGITGVTTCEHLIDGTVSTRVAAPATLRIGVHLRIEAVEV